MPLTRLQLATGSAPIRCRCVVCLVMRIVPERSCNTLDVAYCRPEIPDAEEIDTFMIQVSTR